MKNTIYSLFFLFLVVSMLHAEEFSDDRRSAQKQKHTYWFGKLALPEQKDLAHVQFMSKRKTNEMQAIMRDVFYVHEPTPCSALDNISLGYNRFILVSFNGQRFQSESKLREWIDAESPDSIKLSFYSSRDNFRKLKEIEIKSKEALAEEFVQQLEHPPLNEDERSKNIRTIVRFFQGRDRETVAQGLMQCRFIDRTKGQRYYFSNREWNTAVSIHGWIDLDKKKIEASLRFDYIGDDWIYADSITMTSDHRLVYSLKKIDFEREEIQNAGKLCYRETTSLPLVGQACHCIDAILDNKEVKIIFQGEGGTHESGEQCYPEQIRDLYEAYRAIHRHFLNP